MRFDRVAKRGDLLGHCSGGREEIVEWLWIDKLREKAAKTQKSFGRW